MVGTREHGCPVPGVSRNKRQVAGAGCLAQFSVSSERSLRQPPVAVLVSSPTEHGRQVVEKLARGRASRRRSAIRSACCRVIALSAGRGIVQQRLQPERLRVGDGVGLGAAPPSGRGVAGVGFVGLAAGGPSGFRRRSTRRSRLVGIAVVTVVGVRWICSLSRPPPLPTEPVPDQGDLAVGCAWCPAGWSGRSGLPETSQARKRSFFSAA